MYTLNFFWWEKEICHFNYERFQNICVHLDLLTMLFLSDNFKTLKTALCTGADPRGLVTVRGFSFQWLWVSKQRLQDCTWIKKAILHNNCSDYIFPHAKKCYRFSTKQYLCGFICGMREHQVPSEPETQFYMNGPWYVYLCYKCICCFALEILVACTYPM